MNNMSHVSFTDIKNFYHIRKLVHTYPHLLNGKSKVTYRAKIKLHGQNAGIKVTPDGQVIAMSRERVITPEDDCNGFAKWVDEHKDKLRLLALPNIDTVINGEWCGSGIQRGVAICQVPHKIFAIFSLRSVLCDTKQDIEFISKPSILSHTPYAHILPWHKEEIDIDWSLPAEELQPIADRINEWVKEVEECDPWVKSIFNVEGIGEGLVFYPVSTHHNSYKSFGDLSFKAKGEAHKTIAHTKPVQIDPAVAANVEAFAEMVVTDARLEQGARVVAGGELDFDQKFVGPFLKWIGTDVAKETQAELDASMLDSKLVAKACGDRARKWYVSNMRKL